MIMSDVFQGVGVGGTCILVWARVGIFYAKSRIGLQNAAEHHLVQGRGSDSQQHTTTQKMTETPPSPPGADPFCVKLSLMNYGQLLAPGGNPEV